MNIHERKFSPREAAGILGVSRQTVIMLITHKRKDMNNLRAIKIGGQWKIRESALAEFMEKNETKPGQVRAF